MQEGGEEACCSSQQSYSRHVRQLPHQCRSFLTCTCAVLYMLYKAHSKNLGFPPIVSRNDQKRNKANMTAKRANLKEKWQSKSTPCRVGHTITQGLHNKSFINSITNDQCHTYKYFQYYTFVYSEFM
jgi:hypothetical protein